MDLHTTSEELAKELDVPLISVAPSVRYSLQVEYVLPSGEDHSHTVTGPWEFMLEMLQNGPAYWDTVNVTKLTIRKLDESRHYYLGRDSSLGDDV